jgi:hypothetical protein
MFARTILVVLALLATACGAGQRPADAGPRGTLRVACEPATAIVEIDERRLGPVSMFEAQGVLLRPGQHRVIVRAEGYFAEYRLTVLEIALRPVPE